MKITFKLRPDGVYATIDAPRIDLHKCMVKGADGKEHFSDSAFNQQAAGQRHIQVGSKDHGVALHLGAVVANYINSRQDACRDSGQGIKPSKREKFSKAIAKGRVEYVQVKTYNHVTEMNGKLYDGVKAEIEYDNNDIPSGVIDHAHEVALICAKVIKVQSEVQVEGGKPPIALGENAARLMKELNEYEKEKKEERELSVCANRCGEYCSPSNTKCKFYNNGKCRYIKKGN